MSRSPAFLAATAFAAGVWLGMAEWRPPAWWMIALAACAAGALLLVRSSRVAFALALLALAALGALEIAARDQARARELSGRSLGAFLSGDEVLVTGHVLRDSNS